jgi:hypothetical protein
MKKISLQAFIDTFRTFVYKKGWSIIDEKEIAHGYQLIVSDGVAKTPVALFSSGKALVQGKPSMLQIELKQWVYGTPTSLKNANEVTSTQPQLLDDYPL